MPNGLNTASAEHIRVRACGLVTSAEGLLLANHPGLYGHDFWLPPGGRVEFGSGLEETVIRELQEECHLSVKPSEFRFACSVRRGNVHAVEFFFASIITGGTLTTGQDPERGNNQILSEVRFISFAEIMRIPLTNLHPVFGLVSDPSKILDLKGFFELS